MHKNVKELEEIAESKVVNHLWKNIKKAYRNALSRLVRRAHGSGSRKRHSYPCTLPSGASGYRHYDKALLQTRKATKQLLFRIKINKVRRSSLRVEPPSKYCRYTRFSVVVYRTYTDTLLPNWKTFSVLLFSCRRLICRISQNRLSLDGLNVLENVKKARKHIFKNYLGVL